SRADAQHPPWFLPSRRVRPTAAGICVDMESARASSLTFRRFALGRSTLRPNAPAHLPPHTDAREPDGVTGYCSRSLGTSASSGGEVTRRRESSACTGTYGGRSVCTNCALDDASVRASVVAPSLLQRRARRHCGTR